MRSNSIPANFNVFIGLHSKLKKTLKILFKQISDIKTIALKQ